MSEEKPKKACWNSFKDLIEGKDRFVAESRIFGVILACVQDIEERLTELESKK